MATVIKEAFVESNNHTEVIFQTDKPVIDFELNEAQRIPRVSFQRLLEDAVQKVYSGEDFSPGSNDDGFKPTPGGANTVNFAAGSIIMQGTRARVTALTKTDLAYGGGGTATYAIYARIEETEVADPAVLQTLGETTRRRKLAITLVTSQTGLVGVPTSSPLDLWEGGIRYEAICTVLRRSGDSSVLTGDITDLRRLLPSSVLTNIHRQKNFSVTAVVAPQFESLNALEFVSFASQTPLALTDGTLLFMYHVQSTIAFGPQYGSSQPSYFTARYRTSGTSGNRYELSVGNVGTRGVVRSEVGILGFADDRTGVDAPVDLTSVGLGGGALRLFEKVPAFASRRSLVGKANAAWAVTCGDNVNSFGDFSGASAVSDAFAYFLANVYSASATACCLRVKLGVYTLTTSLVIPAGVSLTIEGASSGVDVDIGTNIAYAPPTLIDAALVVQAGGTLHISKCALLADTSGAVYTLAISSAGDVYIQDCFVYGSLASGAHQSYNSLKPQVGIYAKNTQFKARDTVVSDQSFIFAPAGSSTLPGQGRTQRIRYIFESCTFTAAARGSIVDVRGSLETENYIDELKFVDCLFSVAYNHTTDSPAGILTCYSTGARGGYMTVRSTVFEDCRVARSVANKASPIVFDLRASNATDATGVGVYFEHIHMRNCDWRVLEDATRVHAPWHLGQNSPSIDLGLAVSVAYSIRRLTIEDTLFGFMDDGTNPSYTNAYGYHRAELSTSPYRAALSLHAENIVVKEVEFTQALGSSKSAEVFLPAIQSILVDGLRIIMSPAIGTNLPTHRIMAYARGGNLRTGREKYSRVFRRVSIVAPFTTTALTTEPGLVSIIPGGNMVWEDCLIQGGSTDIGICINPREAGVSPISAGNWDYSGFVLRKSTLSGMREGFRYTLPTTGSVNQIEQIELDGVIFNDINTYFFNFTENDPAGSVEYFTRIQARVVNCLARFDETLTVVPGARFRAGRPWDAATPAKAPYNLWMQGNNFGISSNVTLGANGSIFTNGLTYFVMGNCCTVSLWLYDGASLAKTVGLHTGYTSLSTAISAFRSWADGQFMVQNSGLLELLLSP